ncbi:zinc finger protein 208 isoform X1 [Patella vulgata]|uniref:zinc finger protein 208 isoform X1 n=1 Tax=Patella vulgata TaxID=6465 RepID=UPI0024A80574|nr:zinc finger protein 208 isoform X1 [Patella vulgata]
MGKKLVNTMKKCPLCFFTTTNKRIFKSHRAQCKGMATDTSTTQTLDNAATSLKGTPTSLDSTPKSLDSTVDSEWESICETTINNDNVDKEDIEEEENGSTKDSSSTFDAASNQEDLQETSSLPSPRISRNYNCSECKFTTTKARVFLNHRRDNHDESFTIYPCNLCEYASQYKHKLQRHEAMAHKPGVGGFSVKANDSKPSVKIVKKTKKLPAIPKLKVKLTNNGSAFSKVITTKTKAIKATKKRAARNKAYENVVPLVPPEGVLAYRCKLCLYKGKSRPRVLNHVLSMHLNAKQLKCKLCSFKTNRKIELYLHKKEHASGKEVYRCPECDYISNYKPNLDRHMENHGRDYEFKCNYCNFSSTNSGALARHVTSHHAQGMEEESMEVDGEEVNEQSLEDGLYTCDCGSAHKTAADLNRHITMKHPEKGQDKPTLMESDDDYEEYVTEDEENPTDSELGSKSLNCKYCSYNAKNPSDMKKHMTAHSLEKRYKCPICWKKYKYTGDLNVHIKRDHNEEPGGLDIEKVSIVPLKKNSPTLYRCPACPYTTNWKSEMERHSHVHGSEDKTYQCNYCMYQTYWRGDITRHLYRKHEDKISKDDDILHHVIFRNELVVPKGKSRYGNAQDSPVATMNIKQEVTEPEVFFKADSQAEVEKDWETQSVASTTNTKDTTVLGATNNNGIFHCDHCEFTANAPSKMKAHVATHLNFKQFMCPVCGKRANWKWDIQKHMKKDHPTTTMQVVKLSEEEAKETIGNYLATMPAVRRSHHLPSPTKSPPVPAPRFTLKIPTIRSIARVPVVEPPSTKPATAITNKSPIAAGQKPYQCSLCGLRSNFRWSISKHLKTIHEGLTGSVIVYKINEVIPSVSTESPASVPPEKVIKKSLSPHKTTTDESMKQFMCVECGKRCLLKGDIKKHYKYMHPGKDVLIKYMVTGSTFLYDTNFVEDKQQANVSLDSSLDSSMDKSLNTSDVTLTPEQLTTKSAPTQGNQTSVHNDPKKHGYVKPFKCSICGHRSNWKWDSKRHLREKHIGSNGFIIVMSIESATETYATECLNPASPEKKPPLILANIPSEDGDRLKRLKCSICEYRSNWRTDIMRHSRKRHPNEKPQVVLLDMGLAKETLESYSYHYQKIHGQSDAPETAPAVPTKRPASAKPQQRIWRCPKCAFCGVGNSDIIKHMQKHNMKPFKCCICEFATNFRGALYRHVRKLHQISDYASCTKVLIRYGQNKEDGDEQDLGATPSDTYREAYVDIFLCKICNFQTSFKYLCCRHLREKHGSTDYTNVLKIRKRQKVKVKCVPKGSTSNDNSSDKGKQYMCSICPYKAFKRGLLNFHMTYHKPQPGNKYKCKFCPYYVCAPRLLHQHMKIHSKDQGWYKEQKTPTSSPQKNFPSTSDQFDDDSLPRKHICEKCPYTTNSKNDFIYHKQFHRPKPSAEFKCEFCDYWVTHKRLLKQHMKLHTDAMKLSGYSSLQSSPCKSEMSDASVIFDTVEIASIKQKIISSKITASLSSSPTVSPMKIASRCGVGSRPGYILKSGVYRKLHRCKKCPYFNVRTRNLRLHEMMHGYRSSEHPLIKCPHCDYYVGAKGLLSHHLKVHQPNYCPDYQDNTISELEKQEGLKFDDEDDRSSDTAEIENVHKVDTLLEIARFKKFCCEKCPYATAKRLQFQRHCELHGSKQRHTCEFCDYSVPSNNLLLQHRKIHMMPNQNLLAAQSLTNLQHLTEVPADVALASALPPIDTREPVTISVIHDHLDLYENMEDLEPKKLYRCDRCPYANVRRDHLLTHLKFHMIRSELTCPYCDYSVPKQNFLTQHIKVHFCPLPELSDWLVQNGQARRAKEMKDQDISEAVELAHKCQTGRLNNITKKDQEKTLITEKIEDTKETQDDKMEVDGENNEVNGSTIPKEIMGPPPPPKPKTGNGTTNSSNTYICQYCDREFAASDKLLRHEMQHLIGNHFEAFLKTFNRKNGEDVIEEQPCETVVFEDKFSGSKTTEEKMEEAETSQAIP